MKNKNKYNKNLVKKRQKTLSPVAAQNIYRYTLGCKQNMQKKKKENLKNFATNKRQEKKKRKRKASQQAGEHKQRT